MKRMVFELAPIAPVFNIPRHEEALAVCQIEGRSYVWFD